MRICFLTAVLALLPLIGCMDLPNPEPNEDAYLYDRIWVGDGPIEGENPISVKLKFDPDAPFTYGEMSGLFLAECEGTYDGYALNWSCAYDNTQCLGRAEVTLAAVSVADHLVGVLDHDGCADWSYEYDGLLQQ